MKRIEAIPAGLRPECEFTPAVKPELLLDLLAHHAALPKQQKGIRFSICERAGSGTAEGKVSEGKKRL